MNSNLQEKVSRFVRDEATFRWKIENFSVEKLLETEGEFLESPSYQHSNIDWKLKLRRKADTIELHLIPSETADLLQLAKCEFKFHAKPGLTDYAEKFTKPLLQMRVAMSINNLQKDCVVDDALTVSCELTMDKRIDVLSRTEITASEKEEALQQRLLTLSETFGSILDESKFSDVTLKVGGDTFQAHKAILVSRSKVFDGMFQSGMKESQESVVQIVDMKSSTAKEMLRFIYAGDVEELSMDRAMDLYSAADRYDLQELKTWCKDFIGIYTSADDVCNVAVLADLHHDDELTRAARRVFRKESNTIMRSTTWRQFSKNHPTVYMDLVESTIFNES